MILDPGGTPIGDTLSDEEGILYAEIDTALSVEPKQFHDVVGYYNRFDIFDFHVDRSRREPARFSAPAQPAKPDATDEPDQRPRPMATFGNGVENFSDATRRVKRG